MDDRNPSGDRAVSARRSLDDDFGRSRRSGLAEVGTAAKPNETPSSEARTVVKPSRKSKEVSTKDARRFKRDVRIAVRQCAAAKDSNDRALISRLVEKINVLFEKADELNVPEAEMEQLEELYSILDMRMFDLEDSGRSSGMSPNVDRPICGDDMDVERPSCASKSGEVGGLLRLSEIEKEQFGWETAGDGIQLRDEVKLEAGRYARAARSPPIVPIDTSLSVFVAGLRVKLGSSNLRLENFRSSTRFKFAKAYVKYARKVANLVRESAKGNIVDACFFLLMPSVREAVGYGTSELIKGMGAIKSTEDFEDYVFMSGKFASEDKPGDPNEALESIKKVRFVAKNGALTAVANYFQAVAEKIAEKNCVIKMERLASAVTATIAKLDERLASTIRAEYARLSKADRTLPKLREIAATSCRLYDETSELFEGRSARAAIGSADSEKEVPQKVRAFVKKLVESPVKGCWFCKKEACRRKRRGSDEVCPQCPKYVKDFGIPNLVRLWREERATGKVARTPLTGKTEYAGVASISGTAVPAIWDSIYSNNTHTHHAHGNGQSHPRCGEFGWI
eukprot:g3134.t1